MVLGITDRREGREQRKSESWQNEEDKEEHEKRGDSDWDKVSRFTRNSKGADFQIG